MIRHSSVSIVISAFSLLALGGCTSGSGKVSNLIESSETSSNVLSARVSRTSDVRKIVQTMDELLEPVDGTLTDIQKILSAAGYKVPKSLKEGEEMAIRQVRKYLKNLQPGLVTERADGSWFRETTVNWPVERFSSRDPGVDCASSNLGIEGEQIAEGVQSFSAFVKDECTSAWPMVFLSGEASEKSGISARFDLKALKPMFKHTMAQSADNCMVMSDAGTVSLHCGNFSETIEGMTFEFAQTSVVRVGKDLTVDMVINVSQDGQPIAQLTAEKEMGESLHVRLKQL